MYVLGNKLWVVIDYISYVMLINGEIINKTKNSIILQSNNQTIEFYNNQKNIYFCESKHKAWLYFVAYNFKHFKPNDFTSSLKNNITESQELYPEIWI